MHNAQNDSYEHLLNGKKRLLKANEFDVFKAVVDDEFFIKSISYTALLPIHIRFLCNLIKLKLNFLVIFICKIW